MEVILEGNVIEDKIKCLEDEICEVSKATKTIEGKLEKTTSKKEKEYLRDEKRQLREKERQLREKERQLREKERQLREKELLLMRAREQQSSSEGHQQPPAKRQRLIPSALNVAGSVASKDPDKFIAPKRDRRPLYSHWFATDLYEISVKLKDSSDIISIDDRMYSLPPIDMLTKCATEFKNVALFCSGSNHSSTLLHIKVQKHEDTFSSLLTPIFHNLFGTIVNASIFNQLIIRIRNDDSRQTDKPDHTIAVTADGVPIRFIAVSDSKRLDADEGKNQVHAYGLALESIVLFLGFTISHSSIELQVFMGFDRKLSVMDICYANCDNENELKIVLGTLYAAVQALTESPIYAPLNSFTVKCCRNDVQEMDGKHINLSRSDGSLVLHCTTTKMVRKYYDLKFHYIPSEDAISFLPSSKFVYPNGSRYQILQYPYIEGHHTLDTPVQAAAAVRELNKFHEKDFVHGDIRSVNMIVSSNSVTFIDVDLVAKEGQLYPSGYNHDDIPERHSEAKATWSMKKEHDRFALKTLLPPELGNAAAGLTDMNKSLEEIARAIESHIENMEN